MESPTDFFSKPESRGRTRKLVNVHTVESLLACIDRRLRFGFKASFEDLEALRNIRAALIELPKVVDGWIYTNKEVKTLRKIDRIIVRLQMHPSKNRSNIREAVNESDFGRMPQDLIDLVEDYFSPLEVLGFGERSVPRMNGNHLKSLAKYFAEQNALTCEDKEKMRIFLKYASVDQRKSFIYLLDMEAYRDYKEKSVGVTSKQQRQLFLQWQSRKISYFENLPFDLEVFEAYSTFSFRECETLAKYCPYLAVIRGPSAFHSKNAFLFQKLKILETLDGKEDLEIFLSKVQADHQTIKKNMPQLEQLTITCKDWDEEVTEILCSDGLKIVIKKSLGREFVC